MRKRVFGKGLLIRQKPQIGYYKSMINNQYLKQAQALLR